MSQSYSFDLSAFRANFVASQLLQETPIVKLSRGEAHRGMILFALLVYVYIDTFVTSQTPHSVVLLWFDASFRQGDLLYLLSTDCAKC